MKGHYHIRQWKSRYICLWCGTIREFVQASISEDYLVHTCSCYKCGAPATPITGIKEIEPHHHNGERLLVCVRGPDFVAGLVLFGNYVLGAHEPLKWTVGRSREDLSAEFKAKGWKATIVKKLPTASHC